MQRDTEGGSGILMFLDIIYLSIEKLITSGHNIGGNMKRKTVLIVVACLLLIGMVGCAGLSVKDRAIVGANVGGQVVLSLNQQYDTMLLSSEVSADTKVYLQKRVAPALDTMKRAEIKYLKAIIAWIKSGEPVQPAGVVTAKGQYETLLTEVSQLLAVATTMDKEKKK